MMKVVIDKNIPYINGVLEPFFDVCYLQGDMITSTDIADASALLVRTRTKCNAKFIAGSKLEFIGSATIGSDHVDTTFCNTNAIEFVNAPGCNAAGVQQWVLSTIITWANTHKINLKGLTVGVVGVGNVGTKVAKSAKALGLNLLCCDPPRKRTENLSQFVDIKTIMKNSDIVTFHVPLIRYGDNTTFHLINEQLLSICKPNVLLLNSSRGEVANTADILDFAVKNPLASLAFDVWENEPNISVDLLNRSFIATTHIAGYSVEGKVNGTRAVVNALSKHFGLPLHAWKPNPNPLENKLMLPIDVSVVDAITSTYQVKQDDIRNIHLDFENYRNSYNYRHDFSGYKIAPNSKYADELISLGFSEENK